MFAARHSLLVAQRRPIAFDVVGAGAGAVGPAGNTWSANFTVTAGSYVFGLICIPGSPPSNVRYGGNVMTLLADSADDRMAVYGLANAPGGSQAFSGNRGLITPGAPMLSHSSMSARLIPLSTSLRVRMVLRLKLFRAQVVNGSCRHLFRK